MGEVNWTTEQQKVIEHRRGNLLVAAAAGSGKTAVLVERIIQMLMDEESPMGVDELLVVTFTNLAAGEMKERIGEALSKELEKNPHNKVLQKQMNLLNHASINTIHSFCLDVIRRNFHQLDLDPNFRVADETEILLLRSEVLAEVLEGYYTEGEELFFDLVETYGGTKYDTPLEEYILKLHGFIQSYPWPYSWLDQHLDTFNIETLNQLGNTSWIDILMEEAELAIKGMEEGVEKALRIAHMPDGPTGYAESLEGDRDVIMSLKAAYQRGYVDFEQELSKASFKRIKAIRNFQGDNQLKEQCKTIRSVQIVDVLSHLKSNTFFKSPQELLEDLKALYPVLGMLVQVVKTFHEAYQEAKKDKGLIDYSDIEHMALDILVEEVDGEFIPSKEAKALQDKYREILIDEYQDSNLVQEMILTSISRVSKDEPNIFMVGDVKQSIYRFRMARPDLFVDKYETYKQEDEALYKRIDLFKNFRSRKEVLDGVNFIFKYVMNKDIGEIVYDDLASLHVGASFKEQDLGVAGGPIDVCLVDVHLSDEAKESESFEELNRLSAAEVEAELVARKIEDIMDPANNMVVFDKKLQEYRRPRYEDIVILMRATSSRAETFIESLMAHQIPAYADTSGGYFDALEVKTMLALLKIIDNPMQDIPLITVLRSPMVKLTVDELTTIRLQLKEGSYYDALVCYAESQLQDTPLGQKVYRFNERLKAWREEVLHSNLHDFIWKLFRETNYYYYVTAMPGGQQRKANLDALLERAVSFEKGSYQGLFNFIRVMEKIKKHQGDFSSAKTLGPNENIVRIMSIHKSKGLEFPITIVSGLGKQFNQRDMNNKLILHQDLGFGTEYVNHVKRYTTNTVAKTAIKQKMQKENLSEELRILYVALTRAKEKLILTGTMSNIEKKLTTWSTDTDEHGYMPSFRSKTASNYLDWIMPLLLRHKDSFLLRQDYDISLPPVEDESSWRIEIYNKANLMPQGRELDLIESKDLSEKDYDEMIDERLNYEYPKEHLSRIPLKITVSDIKRQSMDEEAMEKLFQYKLEDDSYYRPAFIEGKKEMTPAEKGTLVHKAFYHLDLNQISTIEEVQNQLLSLVENNTLTQEEAKVLDPSIFVVFGKHHICHQLRNARVVYKEKPFVIGLQANEVYDVADEELVLVQGVIDCFYEFEDELILLDYKTDKDDHIKSLGKKYKKQMELYTKAIERFTNKKVKHIYLYSTHHGDALEIKAD